MTQGLFLGDTDYFKIDKNTTLAQMYSNTNVDNNGTKNYNVAFFQYNSSSGSGTFVYAGQKFNSGNTIFTLETGVTSIDMNNTGWVAKFMKNGYNEASYKTVASCLNQTGCTGIIKLGGQSETSGWGVDYGDLLIQAIIDCNFKFHTPR